MTATEGAMRIEASIPWRCLQVYKQLLTEYLNILQLLLQRWNFVLQCFLHQVGSPFLFFGHSLRGIKLLTIFIRLVQPKSQCFLKLINLHLKTTNFFDWMIAARFVATLETMRIVASVPWRWLQVDKSLFIVLLGILQLLLQNSNFVLQRYNLTQTFGPAFSFFFQFRLKCFNRLVMFFADNSVEIAHILCLCHSIGELHSQMNHRAIIIARGTCSRCRNIMAIGIWF